MKNSKNKQYLNEMIVGVFFILSMLILAYFTVLASPNGLLEEKEILTASFKDVGSLKRGDNVRMRGVNIGKVTEIKMDETFENVIVEMSLDGQPKLKTDYKVTVESSSVLGGQFVKIHSGSAEETFAITDKPLDGSAPEGLFESLQAAGKFFTTAEELVVDLKKDREYLNKTLKNFATVSEKVKNGEGTVGKLFMTDGLYKEAESTLKKLQDAGVAVEKAGKEVETQIAKNLGEFGKASTEFKKLGETLNKGEGTLGKLLTDDTIYKDLKASSANVKTFTASLNNKDSSINKLLNDQGALYEDLEKTLKNTGELTASLNSDKGTLGKLINDDSLHTEAEATLKDARKAFEQVNHAIQDFREQSPIATFGSIIFGGL